MNDTELDRFWADKHSKNWSLSDIPFYQKGKPADVEKWHNLDYLEIYDKVQGDKWGANGIGKLREVGLTRITEFENCQLYNEDPEYFKGFAGKIIDIKKWQNQQQQYADILKENGVKVHWIDFEPRPPMAAYGPMMHMWAAAELLVVRGGSIVPKMGWNPPSIGRAEFLARWAFWNLNITPLLTIVGKGVCEAGASFFLAEDLFVTALSVAYNQEGLDQLIPVLKRTGTKEVLTIKMPGHSYFDPETGYSAHPDMVLGPLDIGAAVIYPPGCDFSTIRWLRQRGYNLVEVGLDEQRRFIPCNLTIIEPGKVIMHEGAKETIRSVRKLGIDVIETPYSEAISHGGGICCATMLLKRDNGPGLQNL